MKRFITILAALAMLVLVPSAVAASASLFGGATMSGNHVKLVSDLSTASRVDDSSGISFTDTGVTTFASLTQLATKFNVTDDDCAAGSPRFQLNIDGKNVFVYLGASPTFMGWSTQCNTYAGTLALLGTHTVTGIQLVVDSGFAFADKEQTVLVCDIHINSNNLIPCEGTQPGNGAGQQKVTICHRGHTIRVGKPAVKAHMKHGDHMGACTALDKKKAKAAAARAKAKKGR